MRWLVQVDFETDSAVTEIDVQLNTAIVTATGTVSGSCFNGLVTTEIDTDSGFSNDSEFSNIEPSITQLTQILSIRAPQSGDELVKCPNEGCPFKGKSINSHRPACDKKTAQERVNLNRKKLITYHILNN